MGSMMTSELPKVIQAYIATVPKRFLMVIFPRYFHVYQAFLNHKSLYRCDALMNYNIDADVKAQIHIMCRVRNICKSNSLITVQHAEVTNK